MTDLEKLKSVFDEVGIKYKEEKENLGNTPIEDQTFETTLDIRIDDKYDPGIYFGFEDGKLVHIDSV